MSVFQRPAPTKSRRVDHRNRPLGIRSTVSDSRPTQTSVQIIEPTAEQVAATKRAFGVDKAMYESKSKEILVHNCFNQRRGESKPRQCGCDIRIAYPTARNLINHGCADFLMYTRQGRELQNRKSIVLTEDFKQQHAHAQDPFNRRMGERPMSMSEFIEYHISPLTSEATSGLDKDIQSVRLGTIAERKKGVEANRKHHVVPTGNDIDSDSSRDEIENGQGVGQADSAPDPHYGNGLDAADPYRNSNPENRDLPPERGE